ncbi:MAG TPA: sensor histidine kinase [Ktedonobacteraceae bacterium]|jgi:NarL family two-component system sensor histidine kinase LiaS
MKRLLRSFRQLRWKLTLSYTLTSLATFLLIEMLVIGGGLAFLVTRVPDIVLNSLSQQATQGAPYLAQAASNRRPLLNWLQSIANADLQQEPFRLAPSMLAVIDTRGQVVAALGPQAPPPGALLALRLPPQSQVDVRRVLGDVQGTTQRVTQEGSETLVAIAPMRGNEESLQGALVMSVPRPGFQHLLPGVFVLILDTGLLVTVLTGLIGTLFGYLIARGLTRRLKRLSAAADQWSRGDFSALAVDSSQDELGQMIQQCNHMAGQLQHLIETRQQLATLEERNRLARDLHDSVKQQVFAISMQLASTRILLTRDPAAAQERLQKTEKLVHQAQRELTSLIRELRPVALEGQGLVAALRELLPQWAQQTEIVANLRVEGSQTLPQVVEETLFRVVQEALSNIARHSQASLVQVMLSMSGETLALTIQDNGQGFDPAHPAHRGVGLHSMQERIEALGGDLHLESSPGRGTLISAHCLRLGVEKRATPL